ncbi:hypothetical protein GY45DRAFT_870997 [Cubamyces sp. BRFM 1775]|nr:hypothetical protein GY45DRAFT_870997 [Cubamyces sp. BRFM 1775]
MKMSGALSRDPSGGGPGGGRRRSGIARRSGVSSGTPAPDGRRRTRGWLEARFCPTSAEFALASDMAIRYARSRRTGRDDWRIAMAGRPWDAQGPVGSSNSRVGQLRGGSKCHASGAGRSPTSGMPNANGADEGSDLSGIIRDRTRCTAAAGFAWYVVSRRDVSAYLAIASPVTSCFA